MARTHSVYDTREEPPPCPGPSHPARFCLISHIAYVTETPLLMCWTMLLPLLVTGTTGNNSSLGEILFHLMFFEQMCNGIICLRFYTIESIYEIFIMRCPSVYDYMGISNM